MISECYSKNYVPTKKPKTLDSQPVVSLRNRLKPAPDVFISYEAQRELQALPFVYGLIIACNNALLVKTRRSI